MFSALKVRNYRIYWIGMFVSLIGTWIQSVAQSWLVFKLTNSVFLLGVVGFLNTIPVLLFSLFGGAFADRVNKRIVLLYTQSAFMVLAFVLAVLTQLQIVETWHIMVIAVLNGIVMAFDAPSRQSMAIELVGKEHLLNAIAWNSAAFNSARIIGPALAGILVAVIGMSGCFYLNGVSFCAVIVALMVIRNIRQPSKGDRTFLIHDIIDGLRFMKHNRIIVVLITIVGIMSFFGLSYVVLMPVFAERVLHTDVSGFGLLMSAAGFGALIAALMLARLGDFRRKGKLLIVSCGVFSIALIVFSLSKILVLSLACLVLVGWASVMSVSIINTLLQTIVPDEYRGRVMSGFMVTFAGVLPFGNLANGALAHACGVSNAILISAVTCGISIVIVSLLFPRVRNL